MKDGNDRSLTSALEEYFVEHASDAMVLLDHDGVVRAVNRAAFELLGVNASRHFDGSDATATEVRRFLERIGSEGRATVEIQWPIDAGGLREIALQGVSTESGRVIVLRDVTRTRALESELRQLQRVESAGLLTASIVHDLNNLLTPILCLGEMIKHEASLGTSVESYSSDLVGAAERAADLVRQVLAFVRRGPIANEHVNLGDILTEMRSLLERLAGDGIELSIAVDTVLGDTRMDQEQFGHVVINLVANARDAMPRGGRITIGARNATLQDGGRSLDYVALSVADTGVGIGPESRDRIFEKFFTTKERGTGLGLATAQRFVAEHGGRIIVESESGRGTVVTLYFPREMSVDSPVLEKPERVEIPRGVETVLVVDTDDRVRHAIRVVLEERGYRVLDVSTGGAALEQLEKPGIDLVLADATLDDLPATVIFEKCRQMKLPAVFMSGRPDHELLRRGPEYAQLVTLRKAFAPEHLARTVRAALDGASRLSS